MKRNNKTVAISNNTEKAIQHNNKFPLSTRNDKNIFVY